MKKGRSPGWGATLVNVATVLAWDRGFGNHILRFGRIILPAAMLSLKLGAA
jgi:hypothetical protein